MRILTWNILHGGGRHRLPHLLMAMLDLEPDIVVVTEARRRFAGQLAAALADAGLAHHLHTDPPDNVNGVLLVSRSPLRSVTRPDLPECLRYRWIEAELPDSGLAIAGVHLAEAAKRTDHALGWRTLLRAARARRASPFAIAGDLNAWRVEGGGRSGPAATNFGRLVALGYTDAWAASHPESPGGTWSDHAGREFRLDYVLLSRPLAGALCGAQIAHVSRQNGLSDHAALVVEVDESARAERPPTPKSLSK